MFDYEVIGYVIDGEIYCPRHIPDGYADSPIFAGTEGIDNYRCNECGDNLIW